MTVFILTASLIINISLFALARRSMRTWRVAIPLGLLCCALPVLYLGRLGLFWFVNDFQPWWPAGVALVWVMAPMLLYELAASMLHLPSELPGNVPPPRIPNAIWFVRLAALIAGAVPFFLVIMAPVKSSNGVVLGFARSGTYWLAAVLCLYIAAIYHFEKVWRGATPPQRRIMQACFTSILVIAVAECIVLIDGMLFHAVTRSYIENASIAGAVFSIGIPLSFLRYRLAEEKISVARNMVYSSVTLFTAGAVLLGISLTAYAGRALGIVLPQTGTAVVLSATAFLVLIALTSGSMRKKVIRYVNEQFYHRKYDYRDLFHRISRTYRTDERVGDSLLGFLEQLRYILTVEEAFVFVRNAESGDFRLFYNSEYSTPCDVAFSGSGPLARALAVGKAGLVAVAALPALFAGPPDAGDESALKRLRIAFLYPVRHRNELVGILGVRDKRAAFDEEDTALIEIFAGSIGALIWRARLVQQQIEDKQFESFARIAAFIIHDIKNQISTLSLISRNALTNIARPDFQQSMLASLTKCTTNLQALIDKLGAPLRQEPAGRASCDVNEVAREAVETTARPAAPGVSVDFSPGPCAPAPIDRTALSHVVNNLIVNAIESMRHAGALTVRTGPAADLPAELRERMGAGERIPSSYTVFISVADTGPGMTAEFIETRLFRPFSSTKDKGIGIGLYQCKTIIEGAAGRLVCRSRPGEGALFCILL